MEITLVFPHQLFEHHPGICDNRNIALIADGLILGGDPQWPLTIHPRKLKLHQQTMLAYQKDLASKGFSVCILTPNQNQQTSDLLNQLIDSGYQTFYMVDPIDDLLNKRVKKTLERRHCILNLLSTPMLLTPTEVMDKYFSGRRKPMMGNFYQMQRKRLGVLIDDQGAPVAIQGSTSAGGFVAATSGGTVNVEVGISQYDTGSVLGSGEEKYLGKYQDLYFGAANVTAQFQLNGSLTPGFPALIPEWFEISRNAVEPIGEVPVKTLDQYRSNYSVICHRLSLPNSSVREIAGQDTRGINLAGSLNTTNVPANTNVVIFLEHTSVLQIGQNKQFSVVN